MGHGSSAEKGAAGPAGGTFSTARNQSASRNGNYTCLVGSLGLNVAWPGLELRPSWSNLLHILHPISSSTTITNTSHLHLHLHHSAEETQTQPEHTRSCKSDPSTASHPGSPSRRQHLGIPAQPTLDPRPFDDTPTAPKEVSTRPLSSG